jgi:cyclic beta-1,2-glucan synthetase
MDFATRDHYRHVVERLARPADGANRGRERGHRLAWPAHTRHRPARMRTRHVGYYLAGKGRRALEERLNLRPGVLASLRRAGRQASAASYLGTADPEHAAAGAAVVHAALEGAATGCWCWSAVLARSAPASWRWRSSTCWPRAWCAAPLPRMDFSEGHPARCAHAGGGARRCCTAAPTSPRCAKRLEVRYLANRDPQLRFCLLTDLPMRRAGNAWRRRTGGTGDRHDRGAQRQVRRR